MKSVSLYPEATSPRERVRAWLRDVVWRNSSRHHLEEFVREAGLSVKAGQSVLDAGAGVAPYRRFFSHTFYETADFGQVDKGYGQIDHVCDLADIPVEAASYDLVLCTQVLEHVPDADAVLGELRRVLKPGGRIWLTTPLFYPEHEQPHDFHRFTQFGLRRHLSGADLQVERLEWLEGYAGTVSFQLKEAALRLPHLPREYSGGVTGLASACLVALMRPAMFVLSAVLASADARNRYTADGHCKNYAVVCSRRR